MARAAAPPRQPAAQPGTFSRILTALGQCLKWLALSLLFSILLEWIGLLFWWPQQGLAHSQALVAAERGWLAQDLRRSLLTHDPLHSAEQVLRTTRRVLFESTGLDGVRAWLRRQPAPGERGLRVHLHGAYVAVALYIEAALQITQLFILRLTILALASPVFALFALVGLVDGLVRRDLRRWGGGRESSFVYHYAKHAAAPLLIAPWVIYLALPVSVHPAWIVQPFAIGFGLAVSITASTFKKYL